jgi:hypothetical protein
MEEEKKESLKESVGDQDDGKEHQNFCLLCGKYTKDALIPLQIGSIGRVTILVNGCPKYEVIINNAARMFREALVEFQKQQVALKEAQVNKIIVPTLGIPRNLLQFPKKKK